MTITEKLALALRRHHEYRLSYSIAKRRANATCGDFKESALSALIESAYTSSELHRETIEALDAFKDSHGDSNAKQTVPVVQSVGVVAELLEPSVRNLDAWECETCDGTGSISEPGVVTIANGEKHQSGWVDSTCPTCGGLKYCGPAAVAALAAQRQEGAAMSSTQDKLAEALREAVAFREGGKQKAREALALHDSQRQQADGGDPELRNLISHLRMRAGSYSVPLIDNNRLANLLERAAAPAPVEQAEPVGEMKLSELIEGLVIPVVPVELPVGTKLYAAPAQPAAGGVPEGYALVPVEPTPEMLGAFIDACSDEGPVWNSAPADERQEIIGQWAKPWAAMLAAAPQAGGEKS